MNVIPIDTSALNSLLYLRTGTVVAEVQVVWNQGMAVHQFASLTEPLSSQGLNYVFSFKLAEVHDLKFSILDESLCTVHCIGKAWYIILIWPFNKVVFLSTPTGKVHLTLGKSLKPFASPPPAYTFKLTHLNFMCCLLHLETQVSVMCLHDVSIPDIAVL